MKIEAKRTITITATRKDLINAYLDRVCEENMEYLWDNLNDELLIFIPSENPEERAEILKRRLYIEAVEE